MTSDVSISEIAERLDIRQLWAVLSLPGEAGKCVRSPFREESKPSFSVFNQGGRWRFRDHGNGDHGDALDFIARAKGCDDREALAWAKAFLGMADRYPGPRRETLDRSDSGDKKPLPVLRHGMSEELQQLSKIRGFGIEGLRLAEKRGFLGFTTFAGSPCWAVKDKRGQLMEFRRLDGCHFDAYKHLPERKSHCKGNGKSHPLGIEEAEGYQKVALVEGAADFLATFSFLVAEGKADTVAPCAMLGAANHRIAPDALDRLSGKLVAIYPHCDEAGRSAAREWAEQLRSAGADVVAFDLSGCIRRDGKLGKDLADVCLIDSDCFEKDPKWAEVLP